MTAEQAVPMARDPLAHFVEESLHAGVAREDVQLTLDRRIVTVINEATAAATPFAEVQDVLAKYVSTVNLLSQTHLVEAEA